MLKKLKLLKKDILITPKDINEVTDSIIHVVKADEQKEKLNYFDVIDVSEQVTMVKPGDVILLEYMHHTIPMDWNGRMCSVTSEDEVVAVFDKV